MFRTSTTRRRRQDLSLWSLRPADSHPPCPQEWVSSLLDEPTNPKVRALFPRLGLCGNLAGTTYASKLPHADSSREGSRNARPTDWSRFSQRGGLPFATANRQTSAGRPPLEQQRRNDSAQQTRRPVQGSALDQERRDQDDREPHALWFEQAAEVRHAPGSEHCLPCAVSCSGGVLR